MALLTGARGDARKVGPVADEVLGLGELGARLGGDPLRAGGTETDHRDRAPARTAVAWCGAVRGRDEHERHVGHLALDLAQRRRALLGCAGPLDVDAALAGAGALDRLADVDERASELHHHRRIARAQAGCERVGRQRSR
jgi:hypothetical protein